MRERQSLFLPLLFTPFYSGSAPVRRVLTSAVLMWRRKAHKLEVFIKVFWPERLFRRIFEVDPFALQRQGPSLHQRVDGADVLAQNSDEKELDGGKQEHADHDRGHADREPVPEQ